MQLTGRVFSLAGLLWEGWSRPPGGPHQLLQPLQLHGAVGGLPGGIGNLPVRLRGHWLPPASEEDGGGGRGRSSAEPAGTLHGPAEICG